MLRKRKYSSSLNESDVNSDEDSTEDLDICSFSFKTWQRTLLRYPVDEVSWDISFLEDSDDEPESISESSDESSSLLVSDSSKDELYFLFLDTFIFFEVI